MKVHQVDRFANRDVLSAPPSVVARRCVNTAVTLVFLAVADERKLCLSAAYSCMYKYCLGELHMSEDAAAKRIRAALTARQFPGRFSRPDVPTLVMAITPAGGSGQERHDHACESREQHAPGHVVGREVHMVTQPVPQAAPRAKVVPLAPQRLALQVTIRPETHDKRRRDKELPAHAIPSGDVAEVLDRALDALIEKLERRRYAATDRPRTRRSAAKGRQIPAEDEREVTRRYGGRYPFVAESGRRCEKRGHMECNRVHAVARGGRSTVANARLRWP